MENMCVPTEPSGSLYVQAQRRAPTERGSKINVCLTGSIQKIHI